MDIVTMIILKKINNMLIIMEFMKVKLILIIPQNFKGITVYSGATSNLTQ
jgi:hypothetical protein